MNAESASMKAKILSHGIRIENEALEYLSGRSNYKRESFVYNDSRWPLKEFSHLSPQELSIKNLDGKYETVVSCIVAADSPLALIVKDDHLAINDTSDPELASRVAIDLLPYPAFWFETDDDGVPLGRTVNTCGLCEANIWLWHDCALPYSGDGCKFCGINSVASKRKQLDLLSVASLSDTRTATDIWENKKQRVLENLIYGLTRALETYEPYRDHFHLIFIAGNLRNELLDLQWKIYVDAMVALNNSGFPLEKLDSTAVLMPPNDFTWIEKARETGLGKIVFNLEIWNPDIFAKYCPGKAKYGRERMLDALKEAVRVFGAGSVWSNFVFGLEPETELLRGMDLLSQLGVVPGANVFHKDKGAQLASIPVPTPQNIVSFYRDLSNLYRRYGFLPFYCEKALRTSLANEAFKGWLD